MREAEMASQQVQDIAPTQKTRKEYIIDLIASIKRGETKLSYSSLSKFKRSPRSFIDYKLKPKEQTDAMLFGSLVHCLVLEPDKIDDKYITDAEICEEIGGAKPRATARYKEWKAALLNGVTVVSSEDMELAKQMAGAVLTNSAAKWVLAKTSEREQMIEWEHEGLQFIGFKDADGEVTVDLKVCADAEPKKFQRDIINMEYYLQSGIYNIANQELKPYYLIAVDRTLNVSVHELGEDLIEAGINEYTRLCQSFNECMDNNDFHCSFEYKAPTKQGVHIVSRPPWL